MGGDHAPEAIVAGAVAAVRDLDVAVRLVGPTAVVADALARVMPPLSPAGLARIAQVDAADVIGKIGRAHV